MKIFYGIISKLIDVTEICENKLKQGEIITIPKGDINRSFYFGDPIVNTLKSIFIESDYKLVEYQHDVIVKINCITQDIEIINDNIFKKKLNDIHSKLKIKYGSLNDEYPEQLMSVKYLNGNEKVLEIGGNIGRNSLVISSLLNDSSNLVVLESATDIYKQLEENKNINSLNFKIENSALSKRKLIQKDWNTIPSDILLDGYHSVNTITYTELMEKYNIEFDTLVLDCEGAFYYILMDMPEILNNINTIIMENDYNEIYKKQYVDKILNDNHFYRDYYESGGWGCCYQNFFEVWKKSK